MKRDRDQSPTTSDRPAESRAKDHPAEPSNEALPRARANTSNRRCHKTKPCSVVIQRLSEVALRRLIQQSSTEGAKLSEGGRDVGCTPVASPTADESQATRDVGCLQKSSTAQLSKKRHSYRESDDSWCCRDRCSTFVERDDEAGCRSEELSDIINFLIQTDPKGRKEDYVEIVQDSNIPASKQDVYTFAYDPKMTLDRSGVPELSSDGVTGERLHDIRQHNQSPACPSPDASRIKEFEAHNRLLPLREGGSVENLLESKQTQSGESLISASDSEGRLVIDDGNDVTSDNAVLAEAYRGHTNGGESVCEDALIRRDNEPDPTSVSDVADKASTERSYPGVTPCLMEKGESDVGRCSDKPVNESLVPESTPKSSAKVMDKESGKAEELVWLPYISHTMSLPSSGEVTCETTTATKSVKDRHEKEETKGVLAAKGESRKTRLESPSEKHRHLRGSSLRKERKQPTRLCRSRSADAAPGSSKFLSVYTTVRNCRITSVDCQRYRKRRRHSGSRESAAGKSTSDGESREHKRSREKQKEVDVYVTVSKVVRDMVNTTACDMQEITKDSDISDPGLKHLFRAFCDRNGYKYEDFMSEGTEHTASRVLTSDGGDVSKTHKRRHRKRNSHTRIPATESTSSPRKRRKGESPPPAKRMLTRSQRKTTGPDRAAPSKGDHYKRRDAFLNPQGSIRKTRLPSAVPELYSSHSESSVDLSDAIASLEIDSDAGKRCAERPQKDEHARGQAASVGPEASNCGFALFQAPQKLTESTKEGQSFECAKSDIKDNVHPESDLLPRPAACIESDNDEDRLVICDSEPEAETVNPCNGDTVLVGSAETETVHASIVPALPCVNSVETDTTVPRDCDTVCETVLCVNDVPVEEFQERTTEGGGEEAVSEEVPRQCDSRDEGADGTDNGDTAVHEENTPAPGDGCPIASPISETTGEGDKGTTAIDEECSEGTEIESLNEPIEEGQEDAGSSSTNGATEQEVEVRDHSSSPSDVPENVSREDKPDDVAAVTEATEGVRPEGLADVREGQNVEELTADDRIAAEEKHPGDVAAPCPTESVPYETDFPRGLPGHEVTPECSEAVEREEVHKEDYVHVISDNSNDYEDSREHEKSKSHEDEIMEEGCQHVAGEDNAQDCRPSLPPENIGNENGDRLGSSAESPIVVDPDDPQVSCTADIKEEPQSESSGHSAAMDTSTELPLNLSVKDDTLPKPKSDVPVGTVHPQVATAEDSSKSRYVSTSDDDVPINYSHKRSDRPQTEPRPAQTVDTKEDQPKDPAAESIKEGIPESILQRLLLDPIKSDKIAEPGYPLPIIIDVRSLRSEMETVQELYPKNHVLSDAPISGHPAQLDSKQQQSVTGPARQCAKASVSVPPMTFPENRHGMSTLESKIMELKKQIHHLTILANYKEKELGCIRNLRLAKEEALKQLECKYPSIFSPPRTCRGTAPVASAFHTDVPDIVAKAAALSGLTASERNFRAAQHRAAFSDTYSSSQTASKDSAFQTFRKIAPKQPSCVSAEDRHPHIIPLAGPFWIPDLAAGANASPKSPKRHHQDSTASHAAYELPASFRWWSQRTSPDAAAGYGVPATQNDVHRGSSASISSPSGALLDCNAVQSHTAPSLSPLLHMKQSFTYTPRSVPSDSDECAPRTSDTHSRDVIVSARSSSDVYAVQTSVSPDNVREPEGVLQRRALHMYAQLLRGSTEKDPMDITATLLREKQVAAGHSSSQSRAFYNAMDTWMKTAQNIRENVAGSCTTRRENDTKAMPQATSIERQFSEQQADTGHHEARSAASRFRAAVCLNCGDPRVKYVCSCCRTQTFCSELCQMELWSHRNGAGKEA
ncbi:uncharacterized protein LOC135370301 [Ornithodoros turicata]|uniref:uncharacterized protein LOC135370301 n=1 Tax=Ornithodoros turicata TaxID=34597 RepID=UPI003139AEDC